MKKNIISFILFSACVTCLMSLAACGDPHRTVIDEALRNYGGPYYILVNKKNFSLEVFSSDRKPIARYPVSYGLNPDSGAKISSGDNRTPEGIYHVNEILSMDAASDTAAYRKLKAMNEVYFRAREGHHIYGRPDVDLGADAYGPRFFGIDYPNARDVRRYDEAVKSGLLKTARGTVPSIGSGIAIHGNNDPGSIGHRSSSGCVRLYNRDVIELGRYIQLGTPVIIVAR
jgi:murein L,D-transpeptidase YafK